MRRVGRRHNYPCPNQGSQRVPNGIADSVQSTFLGRREGYDIIGLLQCREPDRLCILLPCRGAHILRESEVSICRLVVTTGLP